MSAVAEYIEITQKGNLPLVRPPVIEGQATTMQIDAATRRSLELTRGTEGGRAGSLLSAIDRTVTAGGARLLERRLSSPSCALSVISERQDSIAFLVENARLAADLRDGLRSVHDLDRALSRLALDRGGPRDMTAIRNTLGQAEALQRRLPTELPSELKNARAALDGHDGLLSLLDNALVAEPPLLSRDGGFIAASFDEELDEVRKLRDEGRSVVAAMQAGFIEVTGISALKIKHNNVLGYFIETTATHAEKMLAPPLNETFIHRQTTANQVRFTTVELSEIETRILNAGGRALEIEKRLYQSLTQAIIDKAGPIGALARALAEFDVQFGLAHLASHRKLGAACD